MSGTFRGGGGEIGGCETVYLGTLLDKHGQMQEKKKIPGGNCKECYRNTCMGCDSTNVSMIGMRGLTKNSSLPTYCTHIDWCQDFVLWKIFLRGSCTVTKLASDKN